MDRDALKLLLDQGFSLEQIGQRFGKEPGTVGYWVKKHGLKAVHSEHFAPRGGLTRDQLQPFADSGMSLKAIATELDRSIATVRYWLRRHDLEDLRRSRRPRRLVDPGAEPRVMRDCQRHGVTAYALRDGYYRCLRCLKENVTDRRREVKEILVHEAGGACALCGYDDYIGALHFHHVDPTSKRFAISGRGMTRAIERLREEAAKCVLVCANCHAEVEAGLVTIHAAAGRVPP